MTYLLMYGQKNYVAMKSYASTSKSHHVPVTSGLEQRCILMCEHLSVDNCTDSCGVHYDNGQCPTDEGWHADSPFVSNANTECEEKCKVGKQKDLQACRVDCQFRYVTSYIDPKASYLAQCENTCMNNWSNALCNKECTKYLLPQCVKLLNKFNAGSNQYNDKAECLDKCGQLSHALDPSMHANNAPLTQRILKEYITEGCSSACNATDLPITSESVCSAVFAAPFQIETETRAAKSWSFD